MNLIQVMHYIPYHLYQPKNTSVNDTASSTASEGKSKRLLNKLIKKKDKDKDKDKEKDKEEKRRSGHSLKNLLSSSLGSDDAERKLETSQLNSNQNDDTSKDEKNVNSSSPLNFTKEEPNSIPNAADETVTSDKDGKEKSNKRKSFKLRGLFIKRTFLIYFEQIQRSRRNIYKSNKI